MRVFAFAVKEEMMHRPGIGTPIYAALLNGQSVSMLLVVMPSSMWGLSAGLSKQGLREIS